MASLQIGFNHLFLVDENQGSDAPRLPQSHGTERNRIHREAFFLCVLASSVRQEVSSFS
jgi:hypothetical protein